MKKITKILLPIASTAAVVAPVATLTSCSFISNTTIKDNFEITTENYMTLIWDTKNIEGWSIIDCNLDSYPSILDQKSVKLTIHECKLLEPNAAGYRLRIIVNGDGFHDAYQNPQPGDEFKFTVNLKHISGEKESQEEFKLTAKYSPN